MEENIEIFETLSFIFLAFMVGYMLAMFHVDNRPHSKGKIWKLEKIEGNLLICENEKNKKKVLNISNINPSIEVKFNAHIKEFSFKVYDKKRSDFPDYDRYQVISIIVPDTDEGLQQYKNLAEMVSVKEKPDHG